MVDGAIYPRAMARAAIHPDGTIDPFSAVDAQLNQPASGITGAVVGQFLYMFGGNQYNPITGLVVAYETIQRAAIGVDGTLGMVTSQESGLVEARGESAILTIGNAMYLFGGVGGHDLEHAVIHADGSLDAFATLPHPPTEPTGAAQGVVLDNSAYVIRPPPFGQTTNLIEQATLR
jgi:hypothetical protein